MKLAEALILRADAQKRLQQLRERLVRSARVQEGDTPPEDPQTLLDEAGRVVAELNSLVKWINQTNAITPFDEARTLTDALADRDALGLEHGLLSAVLNEASISASARYAYSQSNIKYFRTIDVAPLQQRADELARQRRDLDARIQALNWNVDLVQ